MKTPITPPPLDTLLNDIFKKNSERFIEIYSLSVKPDQNEKYYHWDKLRHLKPPHDLTSEEWWFMVKSARKIISQTIPHPDKEGKNFKFCEPDVVKRLLQKIDFHGRGELKTAEQVANPHTRDMYLINSLIEEAITSSQLEGAATTHKVAKKMLREKRKPRDKSEKMIFNNYNAMQFINEIAMEDLTPALILEFHKILTEGTLDNPKAEGKLRESDDIYVGDERDATTLHIPPACKELPSRLKSLCKLANDELHTEYVHPVIRAVLLHFLLAYDHPFEDGNGRTARALFYWSMRRQNYWTIEFISISSILKIGFGQYMRSYLYTETDDNDVTYFIVYQLQIIVRAIEQLFEYLKIKSEEIQNTAKIISKSEELQKVLNSRQLSILTRALKKPESIFTVESHRGAHGITYDTARTDLLRMEDVGLLIKSKPGKAFIFSPAKDLVSKIKHFES